MRTAEELPAFIFAEKDEETGEKRWFSMKGMGVEYVRASDAVIALSVLTDEITRLRSELANARSAALERTAAMERAITALSDWAVTYAPDMCSAETVEKSKRRIREGGATLAYIAGAIDMLRAALKAEEESRT